MNSPSQSHNRFLSLSLSLYTKQNCTPSLTSSSFFSLLHHQQNSKPQRNRNAANHHHQHHFSPETTAKPQRNVETETRNADHHRHRHPSSPEATAAPMLPVSNIADFKKHKTPPDLSPPPPSSHDLIISKSPFFFLSPLSLHPRSCLILALLTLQVFLLTFFQYLPFFPSSSNPHPSLSTTITSITALPHPNPNPNPNPNPSTQCESGKFYIYDLPTSFNTDVYKNCETMSPWGSLCGVFSNGGFGPPATGLRHVIPSNLSHAFYWTDQFSSEIIFHNRLIHHKCRTMEPESATAFYIPFYAGLFVGKYLWSDNLKDKDKYCEMMLDWLDHQPYFNRSIGLDHFLVMGRITWDFRRSNDLDWGSRCIYMPSMQNITRLLIERDPRDQYDVGVPYPTGFHPEKVSDVVLWQDFVKSRERKSLFCFAGGTRGYIKNDFRGLLLDQCRDSGGSCRNTSCPAGSLCANSTSQVLETFLDSDFCLQPRGDSYTRRSTFDCMLAGSIPVFFWRRTAYLQYEWFLPTEPESYSVFIHRDDVRNGTSIKSVLERFSKEEVKRMREKVVEFIPNFIYSKTTDGLESMKDAVDLAVDGVLKRMKEQREKWFDTNNGSNEFEG